MSAARVEATTTENKQDSFTKDAKIMTAESRSRKDATNTDFVVRTIIDEELLPYSRCIWSPLYTDD